MNTVIVRGAALTAQPFASQPPRPPRRPRARPRPARRSSRGCRPARAGPRRRSRAAQTPSSPTASSPTATSAARRSDASRTTPPLPTRSRPTSNCGLTSARQSKLGAAAPSTAGSTFPKPMKETSITIRSGAHGSASALERARVACARSPSRAGPGADASAARRRRRRTPTTASAPRWSRQSVKPPVEAPTSRQRRPPGSTPKASSAFASLIPPRETNGGAALDDQLGVLGDQLPRLASPGARRRARRRPAPRPRRACATRRARAAPAGCRGGASARGQRTRAATGSMVIEPV